MFRLPTVLTLMLLWPAAVLADNLNPPPWEGDPNTTRQDWGFAGGANDATPDPATLNNPYGTPGFDLLLGGNGAVWLASHMGRSGVWKLDDTGPDFGTLSFNVPNDWAHVADKTIHVQVTYKGQVPGIRITGLVLDSDDAAFNTLGGGTQDVGGGWKHLTAEFDGYCTALEIVNIESTADSITYIDQVVIHTICNIQSHDVSLLHQSGLQDCGPTAAAACLKWFQQNGYPDIQTTGGSSALGELKKQLEKDAETDSTGTHTHKLRKAMNKLIDGTTYKGCFKARWGLSRRDRATSDFRFLDREFANGEDVLMLICYGTKPNISYHYVVVRNITRLAGAKRRVEYMDPATGTYRTADITDAGDSFTLTYEGESAYIWGILAMSPINKTASSWTPGPGSSKKIVYKPVSTKHHPMRDLHVRVSDCASANYSVTGLPAGWTWSVKRIFNGRWRCYLSFYPQDDVAGAAWVNGDSITVVYNGTDVVKRSRRAIHQSTDGTFWPNGGALPSEPGFGIVTVSAVVPDAPGRPTCAVVPGLPGELSVSMTWEASPSPDVVQYEIYDFDSDSLVGSTLTNDIVLAGLDPDRIYTLTVAARSSDDLLGWESPSITVYRDQDQTAEMLGGPELLDYTYDGRSWHEFTRWTITTSGGAFGDSLVVTGVDAQPEPALTGVPGSMHLPFYDVSSNSQTMLGPVTVELPYDVTQVSGIESDLRMYALVGGVWTDVTDHVDTASKLIGGTLPAPGTFAIVNGSGGIPVLSGAGAVVVVLFLVGAGMLMMRRRRRHGHL